MQLLGGAEHRGRRHRAELAPFEIEARPPDDLAVSVHQDEVLERRVQRAQVHEQLVIGAPVHLAAHRRAARRPRLPVGVRQVFRAIALDRRRPANATPRGERHQRQWVAHDEHTLQQQLLDPQPRDARVARGGEAGLELGPVAPGDGRRHAHQRRGRGVQHRARPSGHSTSPRSPLPHRFIAPVRLLHAAPLPSHPACSRWVER